MNLDRLCVRETYSRPNLAVSWVLMAAYLYYHRDETILSDGVFDELTQTIRSEWPNITHRHKHLVEAMVNSKSSSLFDLPADTYPLICRSAACRLAGISAPAPPSEPEQ